MDYKEKCKTLKLFLTRYKNLAVENCYFNKCLKDKIVSKGLRINKFPNNINDNVDGDFFKSTCDIFNECGLAILKVLIKYNEQRMELDKKEIDYIRK